MSALSVVYAHGGLATPGGVSTDVRQLGEGMEQRGLGVAYAATPSELDRALRARDDALVHLFGCLPEPMLAAAFALAHLRRRRLVWTPVFNPTRPDSWRGYGALRAMEPFDRVAPRAARWADAVVAATAAEAAFFRRWSRLVELLPPGVAELPQPASDEDLAAFRTRAQLDTGRPVVLVVARPNSRKALPFGLAAYARLRELRPDAQLLLVGPDSDWGPAQTEGVCCPGWLTPSEIALAYDAADVLFVPSLYEGLPRVVVEAWSHALPVVATDRIALAPEVADGRGLVTPYGDVERAARALDGMLGDAAARATAGAAGRALVGERFLMPAIVAGTESLYRRVMALP